MIIVGKKCQFCVKQSIKKLEKGLGITIGITAIMLITFVLMLVLFNFIKETRYQMRIKSRVMAMVL